MTIEAYRASLWLGCAVLLTVLVPVAWGCVGSNKLRHGDSLDVSSYPSDIQTAYEVFAVRCSRCHTLARPLNARITDAQHWVRYVTRMRRNPTSGISEKNAQVILRFLLYYMHQRALENKEPDESSQDPATESPESLLQANPLQPSEPATTRLAAPPPSAASPAREPIAPIAAPDPSASPENSP